MNSFQKLSEGAAISTTPLHQWAPSNQLQALKHDLQTKIGGILDADFEPYWQRCIATAYQTVIERDVTILTAEECNGAMLHCLRSIIHNRSLRLIYYEVTMMSARNDWMKAKDYERLPGTDGYDQLK